MRYALAAIASVAARAALAQGGTPPPLALEPGEHAVDGLRRRLERQPPQ
jgi:hypothetical protein